MLSRIVISCIVGAIAAGVHFFCDKKQTEPETRSDAHASTEDDGKAGAKKQDLHMDIDLAHQYGVSNVREENILSTTSQKVEREKEGKSTTIHRSEEKTETGSRNIEQEGKETSTTAQKTRKKAEASSRNIEQEPETRSVAHASTEDDGNAGAEKQDLHMGIDLAHQYGVFNVREENILSTTSPKVEREREGKSTSTHRKKTETGSRNIEQEGEETSTTAQKTRKKAEASSRNIEQVAEKVSTTIKKYEGKKEKWIKHYSSKHHILLVGEGDFSFSACLARAFASATDMVATSLDSEEKLKSKYSTAEKNLQELKKLGCVILHGVDVHTMSKHSVLKTKKFERVIYNFPHAGFQGRESDDWQIRSHQMLVWGFFKSARKMLREMGQVHVTHKTTQPFNQWRVDILGEQEGLVLIERPQFSKRDYPGYDNKRGDGSRSNETFPVGQAATFKFRLG